MGKHVIRAYAKSNGSSGDILHKANLHIYEDTIPEVFISAFYGHFDLQNMTLRYSMAGCEPALLYQKSTGDNHTLKSDGIVLGIIPEVHFEEREIALGSGDVLVLVTDGITEAGTIEERFGINGVGDIVVSSAHLPAQVVAERICEAAVKWAPDLPNDDLGIVVIKIL